LPETEEDWTDIGSQHALEPLLKEQADLEAAMETILDEMNKLKHKNGMIEVSKGVQKSPIKKPKDLVSKINNLERDLRSHTHSLERVEAAIKAAKQLRRQYVEALTSNYHAEMENYIQQISALTSLGLSTQRLPNESDEGYIQRMHDNVQEITTQEQLFDGQLFLIKEVMAKLKSLNLSLDKVESITKLLPDDSKEWILSHWPKVTKEFVKTFGTNPYRVRVEDVAEFFSMMYRTSSGSDLSRSTLKQYRDELDDEYADEMNTAFPPNFELKTKKAERVARMARRADHEGDYDDGEAGDAFDAYDDEVGKGFCKLGKKIVNYDKLMKRNVLDVRHLKKGNIFGFPTATVSDAFVSNVNKLVKGEGVSNEDVEALDNSEQQLFHRMKHVTSIGGTFKDTNDIAAMKNRLKLVEDEIQSGNDSAHLLVEAKDILKVLARQNIITKAEKDRYYKQLAAVNN
jgi:hypothetical protein